MAEDKKTDQAAEEKAKTKTAGGSRRKPGEAKSEAAKPAAKAQPGARKPAAKAKAKAGKQEKPRKETRAKAKPEGGKPAPAKSAAKRSKAPAKPGPKSPADEVAVLVSARARYVRVSPRKARLVADQIRGLPIDRARAVLQFSPRGAARDLQKLLDSAAANAENNHDLVADEMRIAEVRVDEGPTLRRYRPRARGRASRINKRTCHMSLSLIPEE
jgi:ribosomal protein L22